MSVFPLGVWIYCVLASRLEIHQSLTHHLIHSPRSQGLSASLVPPIDNHSPQVHTVRMASATAVQKSANIRPVSQEQIDTSSSHNIGSAHCHWLLLVLRDDQQRSIRNNSATARRTLKVLFPGGPWDTAVDILKKSFGVERAGTEKSWRRVREADRTVNFFAGGFGGGEAWHCASQLPSRLAALLPSSLWSCHLPIPSNY